MQATDRSRIPGRLARITSCRAAALVAVLVGLAPGPLAATPGSLPSGPKLAERVTSSSRQVSPVVRASRAAQRREVTTATLAADALTPGGRRAADRDRKPKRARPVATPKSVLHYQDFEDAFPSFGWQAFDNNGSEGGEVYWDDLDYRAYSGRWAAYCADGGRDGRSPVLGYRSRMDAWMVYGPFSLEGANGGELSFRFWLDTERDYDFFHYMVSVDGEEFFGYRLSGRTGGWDFDRVDFGDVPVLGDVTGSPLVWVAFAFRSDDTRVYEGAYVDDVRIEAFATGSADLAVEAVDVVGSSFAPGDRLTVTNRVRNVGAVASPPYELVFFASTDTRVDANDISLGYVERDGLAPGGVHEYDTQPFLPADLAPGTWYIGAVLAEADANPGNDARVDPVPITVGGPTPGVCVPGPATLCLVGGRYRVQTAWTNPYNGTSGAAIALPQTDFAGYFAFDNRDNVELMLKILDFGDSVKVFYSQLTDLDFTITVTDTRTGRSKQYRETPGDCGAIDPSFFAGAGVDLAAALAGSTATGAAGTCVADADTLCLLDGRFALEVVWRNQYDGSFGDGMAEPLSPLTGAFWFNDPRNVELLTKVLDFGDRVLFFYGALSDLEYQILVTDTATGRAKVFVNPAGRYCGGADTSF